ncbi:MAG TPA: hypothetical protein VJA25_12195, partial [Dehalococcoidia bacterium]|nr:hypothetical protein [Dehalococcoidia bacterium]
MSPYRRVAEHASAMLLLAAAASMLLYRIVDLQAAPLEAGSGVQIFPWRAVAFGAWLNGGSPFWTDLYQGGFPLVAEMQTALFYPPNLLLYVALPPLA